MFQGADVVILDQTDGFDSLHALQVAFEVCHARVGWPFSLNGFLEEGGEAAGITEGYQVGAIGLEQRSASGSVFLGLKQGRRRCKGLLQTALHWFGRQAGIWSFSAW